MNIGYIRVSTQEQNTIRQEVLMAELAVDEVYIDRTSGKNADRPELKKMMRYVRRGVSPVLPWLSYISRRVKKRIRFRGGQ